VQSVDLLWTSGWDSTFRLLHLVLRERRAVQPYYVTDPDRPSTAMEIEAQEAIRGALARRDPAAAALVLPSRIVDRSSLAEDAEIAAAFLRLKQRSYIGYQYDFLAKLARSHGLDALELAVHRDDKLIAHLDGHVVEENGVWLVADDAPADLDFLRPFRFPVLTLTKLDMQQRAREGGFSDLMGLTWFCHYPVNGAPCGSCNPCRSTVAEGLGWRVPWKRRLRAALIKPVRPLVRAWRERRASG
jgi:hypothetical protein